MNRARLTHLPGPVMTTGVADAEHLMSVGRRGPSHKAGSTSRMEAIRAPFKREVAFDALSDPVASEKHPAEEGYQFRAERTVNEGQTTLMNATGGIPGLIEDAVASLSSSAGPNGILRTDLD